MIEARLKELKEALIGWETNKHMGDEWTDGEIMHEKAAALIQALEQSRVGEVRFNEFCCPYPVDRKLNAEQMQEFLEPIHDQQGTLYFSPEVKT